MGYPEPGCSFALPWCITSESRGQTMWVGIFRRLSRCESQIARALDATAARLTAEDTPREGHRVRAHRVRELNDSLFAIRARRERRDEQPQNRLTPHGAFRREVSALAYATNRRVHACEVPMRSAKMNDREPRGKASPHRAESAGELGAHASASSKTHGRALRHGGVRCR